MKKLAMVFLLLFMTASVFASEYMVVNGYSIEILEKYVNSLLDKGWTCQGGVAMSKAGDYIQAMIKED